MLFLDSRYGVLPQAVHNHLPSHHEGLVITDITIQSCSSLNPISKCQLDQEEWHRVEKDLYLGDGWVSRAYIHIKRKKEEELTDDDRVIVDVRTGKLDPAINDKTQASEKWESRPAGIWIKRSAKRHASDSKKTITAVDVLFGADAVESRPGWELVPNGALHLDTGGEDKSPHIAIRRGQPAKIKKPVPTITKDGKFKIMQISDLHLSTGVRPCRDPEPKDYHGGHCDADTRTLDFIARILDDEKPDMVVLSGDQVNGGTAPDVPSVSLCSPLLSTFLTSAGPLQNNLPPYHPLHPLRPHLRQPRLRINPLPHPPNATLRIPPLFPLRSRSHLPRRLNGRRELLRRGTGPF